MTCHEGRYAAWGGGTTLTVEQLVGANSQLTFQNATSCLAIRPPGSS